MAVLLVVVQQAAVLVDMPIAPSRQTSKILPLALIPPKAGEFSSGFPQNFLSHPINGCILGKRDKKSTQLVCSKTRPHHDPLNAESWPSKKIKSFRKLDADPRGKNMHFDKGAISSALSEQDNGQPPRPQRIILIRHGQSEGHIDENAYTCIPDSRIALTEDGWKQAVQCGKRIRKIIESDGEDDWQVFFYVSPYRRTLQTLRGIGMAFEYERIAGVREEPRLRAQDTGNFQDRERMQVEKAVRIRYGRFFYRFPNGESAADVYDRITGFRETLRADIDMGRFQRSETHSNNMNLILVSHGLTLRVFLMRWFKWSVQQFEGLWNFGHTGMLVMELGRGGRYSLSIHHSADELRSFGMTDCMIDDQEWQKVARPGDLNPEWCTSGPSFFHHFDAIEKGLDLDEIPPDVVRAVVENGAAQPDPPVSWPN